MRRPSLHGDLSIGHRTVLLSVVSLRFQLGGYKDFCNHCCFFILDQSLNFLLPLLPLRFKYLSDEMTHQSPDTRQLRLDMQAAQDVINLLQGENERLRTIINETSTDHASQIRQLVEQKVLLESRAIQLSVDLEQTISEKNRFDSELQEALNERRRLASLLQDVRRQVDGRFTKLMAELHAKDEEVHRLEYICRERERDKESVLALEKMLSAREESIRALSDSLSKSRVEHAQLTSTVQQLRIENENLQSEKRHRSAPRESIPTHSAEQLAAILPLYRQWATEMEKDLHGLEDTIEVILDEATDLTTVVERGGASVAASTGDRQRLAAMRKLERAREAAQGGLIAKAAQSSDDMVALSVQAIRHSIDSSQYALSKLKASTKQVVDSLAGTRKNVERTFPSGLHQRDRDRGVASQEIANESHHRALLAEKELKLTEANSQLQASNARISTLELQLKRGELELQRKEEEGGRLSKDLASREQEVSKLRDELRATRDELRAERDLTLTQIRDSESRHSQSLRDLISEHEEKQRELRNSSTEEIRKRDEEIAQERRRCVALQEKEERMRSVLEESKQKRNALKKLRDAQQEEVAELRQVVAQQNKELQHAQDIIESLTMEVERTNAALEQEVSQHEREYLQAAESTAFREWRKVHKTPTVTATRPTVVTSKNSSKRSL